MNYEDLLKDALRETGRELEGGAEAAVQLLALEGARLAAASAEPGFAMVLRASRDLVALRLGIDASLKARATDARLVGLIQSILLGIASRS